MQKIILFFILLFIFTEGSKAQSLEEYLDKGIQNSPLLKDYQNQIRLTSIDSSLIAAAQKPQVDANGGLFYSPTFHNNTYGYDPNVTNGGNYTATIGIQQNIFNQKSQSARYTEVQIQKKSLFNTSKISTNDLKRLITNLYLTLCADNSSILFNEDYLDKMHHEGKLLKDLVEKGIYKQTDYLSFSIQTQSQEILLNQLKGQLKHDLHAINGVCGISDTISKHLELPNLTKKEQTDISLSPLFTQYKIDSLQLINEQALVNVRYQPKISWMADAGFLSASLGNLYQHAGFSAGLNVTIPLYDGHQKKLDYQKLAIREETRSSYASFFKIQYRQQVELLNDELTSNKYEIELLTSQLQEVSELIHLTSIQMNNGNISITDYILATENYISIHLNLTQLKLKELTLINELNYLMQ